MIEIDGSAGEGGGQILRTAAGFSALTGEAFRIKNIRAKRKNPGLRAQHVHAVKAVGALCSAETKGLKEGSMELEFIPGELEGRSFQIDVGTAGSVSLILQALMLPATACREVKVEITGGTDVKWSPPIDYIKWVTLPLLERSGYRGEIELIERGYYPRGGGRIRARFKESRVKGIKLTEPREIGKIEGISHAQEALRKADVCGRQTLGAEQTLGGKYPLGILEEYNRSPSIGSGITLYAKTKNTILGSDSLGERGVRAEEIGSRAARDMLTEIKSGAALDRYMADQIIPYLALAGGEANVSQVTEHARTNAEIAGLFGYEVEIEGNRIRASP